MAFKEEVVARVDAAQQLAGMLADGMLADQMGSGFTCTEIETVAGFLRAWGAPEDAALWLDMHAAGDDEDDEHYERGQQVKRRRSGAGYTVTKEN